MGLWTTRGKKVWRMMWWRRSWRRKRLSLCLACLASSLWSSWSTWDAAWLESRSQTFTSRRRARFAIFYNKKILLKIILKVGSFFFGNGTTFSDEVRFIAKVFLYFTIEVFLEDFQSRRMPGQRKGHFPQICDNLTNGTFPDQQEEVQKVTMNTTLP